MINIRQTPTTLLSPFEQMLFQHFERVKENYYQTKEDYKQAKKDLVRIKYFEKFEWLFKYINFLEVFHINELYRHIELMKDTLGDHQEKTPTKTTLGDFLTRLHLEKNEFGINLLGFKALPSNMPNMYKIYWSPIVSKEKIKDKIETITESYKVPQTKKSKKVAQEEEFDNTIQSRLTQFSAHKQADKLIETIKEKEYEEWSKEKEKQREERKKQIAYEKTRYQSDKNTRKKKAPQQKTEKNTTKETREDYLKRLRFFYEKQNIGELYKLQEQTDFNNLLEDEKELVREIYTKKGKFSNGFKKV